MQGQAAGWHGGPGRWVTCRARLLGDPLWQQGLQARLLTPLHVSSHVARGAVPQRTRVCARVCVHVSRCLRALGSCMAADWRQELVSHKFIFWQHARGWGKGQVLFVIPHGSTSPSPDKPNLLKAQNVCAACSGSALTPGPAGARAAVAQRLGQRAVTHRAISGDLLYCFLLSPLNLWVLRDRYGALGRPCRCWNGLW